MAIGDVVAAEITALLNELKGLAAAFVAADAGRRKDFYIMSADGVLSEANARAVMAGAAGAKSAHFTGEVGDVKVRLRPRAPQRKKDGERGAQMNFWLYLNGAYHKDFNIHVDVVTLEKSFKGSLQGKKDKDGFVMKYSDKHFLKLARELRNAKGWDDLASK